MIERRTASDLVVIALLGSAAVVALSWLGPSDKVDLSRFFGAISPAVAAAVVTLVGMGARVLIHTADILLPMRVGEGSKLLLKSFAWLMAFCVVATATDVFFHFPADLNVAAPWSLIFYPSIGLVAEIIFHLAPLALVLTLTSRSFVKKEPETRVTVAFALVALTEPTFQAVAASKGGLAPLREAITFANVYAFGLVQLDLFRRCGFAAMYGFTIVYYAWWHIMWGALRLSL